jgi:hypothetical protein
LNLWENEQIPLSDPLCKNYHAETSSLFIHQNIHFSVGFSISGDEEDNSYFSFNATEYLKNPFDLFLKENIPQMLLAHTITGIQMAIGIRIKAVISISSVMWVVI